MRVQLRNPAEHFYVELVQDLLDLPQTSLAEYLIERICERTGAAFACLHFTDRSLRERLPGSCRLCPPAIAPRADMAMLKAAEEAWQNQAVAARQPISLGEALTRVPGACSLKGYLGLDDGHSIPLWYRGQAVGTLNLYLLEGRMATAEVAALAGLGSLVCGLIKREIDLHRSRPRALA